MFDNLQVGEKVTIVQSSYPERGLICDIVEVRKIEKDAQLIRTLGGTFSLIDGVKQGERYYKIIRYKVQHEKAVIFHRRLVKIQKQLNAVCQIKKEDLAKNKNLDLIESTVETLYHKALFSSPLQKLNDGV